MQGGSNTFSDGMKTRIWEDLTPLSCGRELDHFKEKNNNRITP